MNDPYVYKDSDVLINSFNIKDQDELNQLESTFFQLSFSKLMEEGYEIKTIDDFLMLHKILFSEIYTWAGTVRKINIFKSEQVLNGLSVKYSDKALIMSDILKCKGILVLKKNASFIKDLTKLLAVLWQTHPFREGNTRTLVVFLYFLLKGNGFNLGVDFLEKHAKYFRNALVLASIGEYSEYEHLENFLDEAIFGKNRTENDADKDDAKYQKIKDFDLSTYKYNYHYKK